MGLREGPHVRLGVAARQLQFALDEFQLLVREVGRYLDALHMEDGDLGAGRPRHACGHGAGAARRVAEINRNQDVLRRPMPHVGPLAERCRTAPDVTPSTPAPASVAIDNVREPTPGRVPGLIRACSGAPWRPLRRRAAAE